MLDRRTTLMTLNGAGLTRAALIHAPQAGKDADRELQQDLARPGAHEYSDEGNGIPTFVACVNLVAECRNHVTALVPEQIGRLEHPPARLETSVAGASGCGSI